MAILKLNPVTGALDLVSSPTPLSNSFRRFREIAASNLGQNLSGGGGGNLNGGIATCYMGNNPMVAGDKAEFLASSVAGISYGANTGYFSIPTFVVWKGSLVGLVSGSSYNITIGGTNSDNGPLSAGGYGLRVLDNNTLRLQIFVGGVLHTQDFTVTGFITSGSTPGRQWIVLIWDGISKLDLYASFSTGTIMTAPMKLGTLTQVASGTFNAEGGVAGLKFGVNNTGTSANAVQINMLTYQMAVRED